MLGSSDEGAFATSALSYAGGFLLRMLSTSTEAQLPSNSPVLCTWSLYLSCFGMLRLPAQPSRTSPLGGANQLLQLRSQDGALLRASGLIIIITAFRSLVVIQLYRATFVIFMALCEMFMTIQTISYLSFINFWVMTEALAFIILYFLVPSLVWNY